MRTAFLSFILFLLSLVATAQPPSTYNSADIYQQLKKLNVLGSVLYIAAHPDDENTRLLAYLSKEKLYRTGYLSLTRGDGGQNLIGNEQGIELGLIRTQELLAARRIDGAEQFFSRAYDFGFSKTADETMRIWNKDKILSDVVWVIRNFQPDVIITRFPGDERAGHGHHAASSLLANEAFTAAADPTKFPEQLSMGVKPWQAKRIFWNTFNFGGTNTTSEDQLKIDVGGYNPLLGKSYGEIASESRSQHKSQGFGVPRQRGTSYEYFLTTGGDSSKTDLVQGIIANWTRVKNGSAIEGFINSIIASYSFENPSASVPALVALYRQMSNLENSYWKAKKLGEVQRIIEACSGLYIEASTAKEYGVQGDSLKVSLLMNKRNNANVGMGDASIAIMAADKSYVSLNTETLNRTLPVNENITSQKSILVPVNARISQPYWLENGMPNGSFDVRNQLLIGKAEPDPSLIARVKVKIEGETFTITRPVQYKFTDPVKGELLQPVVIMPPATVDIDAASRMVVNGERITGKVTVTSYRPNLNLHTFIDNQKNSMSAQPMDSMVLSSAGDSKAITYQIDAGSPKHINVFAEDVNGRYRADKILHTIRYDHIPNITYFSEAVLNVHPLDIKIEGRNIGYIPGAGDKVVDALMQVGYNVTLLNEADITEQKLKSFDALITGIRAYNVHDYLARKYTTLMNYVKNGGNLIVQYNTNNQLGSMQNVIGPYPFTISRTRVTLETAPVGITLPDHPVLNYPNKITASDFEGWIQERSIYQAEQVDSNYATPFTMNDPAEKPSNGSLLIGKYGKGNFVYTGLVFFRELPAGVPGAYRLMANLIALPKNDR